MQVIGARNKIIKINGEIFTNNGKSERNGDGEI